MIDFDGTSHAIESSDLLKQDMDLKQVFSENMVELYIANAVKAAINVDVFESEHCASDRLILAMPANAILFQEFKMVVIDFNRKILDVLFTILHGGNLIVVAIVEACDYVDHVSFSFDWFHI